MDRNSLLEPSVFRFTTHATTMAVTVTLAFRMEHLEPFEGVAVVVSPATACDLKALLLTAVVS